MPNHAQKQADAIVQQQAPEIKHFERSGSSKNAEYHQRNADKNKPRHNVHVRILDKAQSRNNSF